MQVDQVQTMATGYYKVTKDGDWWTIFWGPLEESMSLDAEKWERLFSFCQQECQLEDFKEASL